MENISDEAKALQQQAELKRATLEAYYEVFNSDKGRLVLLDLMKTCYVMEDAFEPDARLTAYNLGRQSVCKRILTTIYTDPEEYRQFMEKRQKEGNQYEGIKT